MKVLMINKFYFLKGGAERVMFDTIKVLEKNGHSVIPFAMKHERNIKTPYEKFFVDHIDFNTSKGLLKGVGNIYSKSAQKKLEALIKQEKPDIAHLHNAYFQISPSILSVLKKYNIPVVLTVHDYHLICPNYKLYTKGSPCEQCKGHKYYNAIKNNCSGSSYIKSTMLAGVMTINKLFKFYEKTVDAYITPSQFMKDKLLEWDYDYAPIHVVNNPVSINDISLENKERGDYLMYAGRFSGEKGIPVLLKSLQKLTHIPIKLIGEGPLKPLIVSMTKNMDNVEILPYTNSKQELFEMVSKARAVIVPSQWYENYPMSVVEAFAVGTPVIGARIGGIPEMVQDGKTGLTFEPGNSDDLAQCIKRLYENKDLSDQFGRHAQSMVEAGNIPDVYYEKIMKVYDEVSK